MKPLEFKLLHYVFRPSLIGTVITLLCIPLFINFGLWQYNKAQLKMAIQAAYSQAKVNDALQFPIDIVGDQSSNIDDWNYKKVTVTGAYETKYQFLLDNQIDGNSVKGNRVGYHVITPLKIEHSSQYVLINRGWILGKDIHAELPSFDTPAGQQTITGQIWLPSKKIFTLEDKVPAKMASQRDSQQPWQAVWQHMNMAQYKQKVPFAVSPMAIKLDQTSEAGGFVRNWQVPAERIVTHIGYAYQWFGFALATLLIYLYMSITRVKPKSLN